MEQNLPCYNGDVAYNPLLNGYHLSNLMPSHYSIQAPITGSPTYHQFCIIEFELLLGKEHSWLDMYLTEPPVTSVRLVIDLPRRGPEHGGNMATELLHDSRGLTFRTIMKKLNEVYEPGHWRKSRSHFYNEATIKLFAGT